MMASRNPLAPNTLRLLETELYSDLQLVVPPDDETGRTFQSHRVILAARCRWFRQALLSGMQEAIDRFAFFTISKN